MSYNGNSIQAVEGYPDQIQVSNQNPMFGNLISEGVGAHNRNFSNEVSSSHTARKFKNNRALKKAYSGLLVDDQINILRSRVVDERTGAQQTSMQLMDCHGKVAALFGKILNTQKKHYRRLERQQHQAIMNMQ